MHDNSNRTIEFLPFAATGSGILSESTKRSRLSSTQQRTNSSRRSRGCGVTDCPTARTEGGEEGEKREGTAGLKDEMMTTALQAELPSWG